MPVDLLRPAGESSVVLIAENEAMLFLFAVLLAPSPFSLSLRRSLQTNEAMSDTKLRRGFCRRPSIPVRFSCGMNTPA